MDTVGQETRRNLVLAGLGLRFALELGTLAAVSAWGFGAAGGALAAAVLGVGAPALAIAWWAALGSPKAPLQVRGALRFLVELVFFGSAVVALAAAGHRAFAVGFGLLVLPDAALLYLLHEDR